MIENFAADYAQEQQNLANYQEAEARGDKAAMQAAYEAHNSLSEAIQAKGEDYAHVYRLFASAQERGNELLDLDDIVQDESVPHLVESFRRFEIERFVYSAGWSSAVETSWLFLQNGCTLEGMVEINGRYKGIMGLGYEKRHGFLFRIN